MKKVRKKDFEKMLKSYKSLLEKTLPEPDHEKVLKRIREGIKRRDTSEKRIKFVGAIIIIIIAFSIILITTLKEKELHLYQKELKTEFTIPDKNIKILWIQKEGFNLKEFKVEVKND